MKSRTLIVLAAGMLVNAIAGVTIASTISITTNPIVIGRAIDVEFDGDFERLEQDNSLDRVYINNGMDIWYIHAYATSSRS